MMTLKNSHAVDTSAFMNEAEIKEALSDMEQDNLLDTKTMLVRDTENSLQLVTFSEPHLAYLKAHPKVDPQNYLSNLKTMIRKRV